MPTAAEIAKTFDEYFPYQGACSYDNVGLLVGREDAEIKKVLVTLDVTMAVIEEAKEMGADMIVSHHPIIFREQKSVTDGAYTGMLLLSLIESGIVCIALHTNYDRAEEGNNDALARLLGAREYVKTEEGFATEFDLPEEATFAAFANMIKNTLGDTVLRTVGGGKVKKVIASCGAGISESMILRAKETGAVIVTADVKHNYAVMARDLGVRLVETTHYASEWAFTREIARFMRAKFEGVTLEISKKNINPYDPS